MYRAPVAEMASMLRHVAGLSDLGEDDVAAVLAEAGRVAGEMIAPLALPGDREGARFDGGAVRMPAGWPALYRQWREGGWNGLSAPEAWGGQGLPLALGMAVAEMWNAASMAFGLAPMLTAGAVEAIAAHAAPALQAAYLPKLISGEWTGTMNLTEPQAGSDLGALLARAEAAGDGTYRVFGQKIFITYGEHDLSDNIVHLVLARLSGAPEGSRGISLFLVPKFLPNGEGRPERRNDVVCAGIERKLGIHASPTCTMVYGGGAGETQPPGAVGWLVGEENRGLQCMFTMMNNARLAVGIQGVAVAEAATQKALAYAQGRRQGQSPGTAGSAPIVLHRDVQRMLLTMRCLTEAARAICYACAGALDQARAGGADAAHWTARADLLTPLAKAFATDAGVEVASLGIQVHGGMGYVEETGAAMLWRDARIAPIYEGTNGIQAADLVRRKLPLQNGRHVQGFLDELDGIAERVRTSNRPAFGQTAERLRGAIEESREATHFLREALAVDRHDEVSAGATPYLRLLSLTAGGAWVAKEALESGSEERAALCRFLAENLLGETAALKDRATGGGPSLVAAAALLSA